MLAGHSVTLAAGFFGYVPHVAWFVPAVETAIAGSIVLAALAALRTTGRGPMLGLTAGVGLVHGLGFSFALREMLQLDGPHLAISLGAFNLGVEIGQIVFAATAWGLIIWVARRMVRWQQPMRARVALGCILTASLWMFERSKPFLAAAIG
jgi:hypothetical protein